MALFKELTELKEKLKYYEEMIPVNNMGKWGRSVAIESYKKKIGLGVQFIETAFPRLPFPCDIAMFTYIFPPNSAIQSFVGGSFSNPLQRPSVNSL